MNEPDPDMQQSPQTKAVQGSGPGFGRVLFAALPVVFFGALAIIFYVQLGSNSGDIPSVLIGKPAPETTLEPLQGMISNGGPMPSFSAADFDGKTTIVNVWASWCAPCRAEHPILMELSRDDRMQIAGINYKDNSDNAVRFLGGLGNPFDAIGVDPRGKATINWGVYGIPETFIVDRNGLVTHKHVGPLTPDSMRESFLPALERAIAGEPAS